MLLPIFRLMYTKLFPSVINVFPVDHCSDGVKTWLACSKCWIQQYYDLVA